MSYSYNVTTTKQHWEKQIFAVAEIDVSSYLNQGISVEFTGKIENISNVKSRDCKRFFSSTSGLHDSSAGGQSVLGKFILGEESTFSETLTVSQNFYRIGFATNLSSTSAEFNIEFTIKINGVEVVPINVGCIGSKTVATFTNTGGSSGGEETTVNVNSVSLSQSSLSLDIGNSKTLTATIEPPDATNQNVTWSTNNSNVSLSPNGLNCQVTGSTSGSSIVTITTEDGDKTATCNITINAAETSDTYGNIILSKTSETITEGSSTSFTVKLDQAPTNTQVVNLSVNNPDVTLSNSSLSFTSSNYSTAQTISITVNKDSDTINDKATITVSSSNVASKTFVLTITDVTAPTTPSGSYNIYLNGEKIKLNGILLPQILCTNFWNGKTWNVLGDSITFGAKTTLTYHAYLKEKLNIATVNNYGIAGNTIAVNSNSTGDGMCVRYENMNNNADIISVAGGVNDHGLNTPLGDISSIDNKTFYGALKILCEGLLTKYPLKTIFFITPMHYTDFFSGDTTNSLKLPLTDYVDAIIKVCRMYSIPVLDNYSNIGIYPKNSIQKSTYTADGLHPNEEGHKKMANEILKFSFRLQQNII